MTDLKLKSQSLPVTVGWRIALFNDGKYKNHPRKFYIESAANEFRDLMQKSGLYERVEVRPIMKQDGL